MLGPRELTLDLRKLTLGLRELISYQKASSKSNSISKPCKYYRYHQVVSIISVQLFAGM